MHRCRGGGACFGTRACLYLLSNSEGSTRHLDLGSALLLRERGACFLMPRFSIRRKWEKGLKSPHKGLTNMVSIMGLKAPLFVDSETQLWTVDPGLGAHGL